MQKVQHLQQHVSKNILYPLLQVPYQNRPKAQDDVKLKSISKDQQNSEKFIRGNKISGEIIKDLKTQIKIISEREQIRKPHLAVVLVGNNTGSISYINRKMKACKKAGITSKLYHFQENISSDNVIKYIHKLNKNKNVDSILCQLPVPQHINKFNLINAVDPVKDVDCLQDIVNYKSMQNTFQNAYKLPCTPNAIMTMLDYHNIELAGKNVAILGKGILVGYPITCMLMQRLANVTTLDKHSLNIPKYVSEADIVISATGVRHAVQGNWIKPGAVVIDAGANKPVQGVDSKKIVGDVEFDKAIERASLITPVPGGVGPMTVAMLLKNVVTTWNHTLISEGNQQKYKEQNLNNLIQQ